PGESRWAATPSSNPAGWPYPCRMSTQRINVSSGAEFEAIVGYVRAVRTGPLVAVAGTTGAGDDIAAQTRDALRRIDIALREAGATLADVVRTRMFVTDISPW